MDMFAQFTPLDTGLGPLSTALGRICHQAYCAGWMRSCITFRLILIIEHKAQIAVRIPAKTAITLNQE